LSEPLAAARAVRALLARRRLEAVDGNYRLLNPKPLEPGEPESIPRKPRRRKDSGGGAATRGSHAGPATYSDVGHVAIDRLIELGREVGTLRSSARQAKEEAREARSAKDDAERIAGELSGRVHDLEAKLEMAEQNLRVLLAAARGGKTSDEPVGSTEMEAILGVLKGG
jgi:hypothetical protein